MRGVLVIACALAVTAAGSAAGGPIKKITPLETALSVTASPAVAGARHVRLTLTLRYEMQCGYPGAGPLVVTLPAGETMPTTFANGSVLVDGDAVAAKSAGTRVTVAIAPHQGVICDVLGPGALRFVFTPRAGLGNPVRAGSYRVTATHARHSFSAMLRITP